MSKNQAISTVLHKSGLYINKYSPVALSCIASVGVVVTAVVAVKATPKAVVKIHADSRKNHDGDPYAYTKQEAVASAWKCYIPAVAIGASTIACIMGANALNRRQQAALTSAYALVQNSYKEYKDKLKELYGEETHNAKSAFTTIVSGCLTAIKNKASEFNSTGQTLMTNFISGVKSKDSATKSAFTTIVSGCLTAIKNKASEFEDVCELCITKFIAGVKSKDASIKETFTNSLSDAISSVKDYASSTFAFCSLSFIFAIYKAAISISSLPS